jgi:hypothetical protein
MDRTARRLLGIGLMLALMLTLPASAVAQSRYLRFEGRVQWISGAVLSVAVNDGPAVAIDLGRVRQGDYIGLAQGDWVIVEGELSPDRRRVVGTGISRVYASSQAP